jgi:hypothetical protein
MCNASLDTIIREMGTKIEGQLGFWQFVAFGIPLICITDESHDRMRLMTPIADVGNVDDELIRACMEANYDRALDARYCINDDTVWGAFMHPLSLLQADQFGSACRQVAELSKNFGTTFSSGELRFGS